MATKAPLAALYGEGEEEQALVDEIKQGYQKLRQSLDNRSSMIDPRSLALVQGFLAPTKTGSFAESLGNAAGMYGKAQEDWNKSERENAAMRMELAQGELAQRQAARGETMFRNLIGGQPAGGAPAAPQEQPQEQPQAAGVPAQPSAQPAAQPTGLDQKMRQITPQDIARLATIAPEKAKILSDMVKLDQERYLIAMNGTVFDRATGKYLDSENIPGQVQSTFDTVFGPYNMTPGEFSRYQKALAAGKVQEWFKDFNERPAGAPGRLTVPETQARAKATEKTAEARATGEAGRFEDVLNKGSTAGSRIAQYNTLKKIASRPDADKIFGVFEGPDVASAMLKLAETGGKGLPNVAEIRDIFTNLGLDKQLKADQLFAAQLIAQANLELRKITRTPGEGAMSDYESRLAVAGGLDRDNTPGGMVKKLDFLSAKADFERQVSKALRASKINNIDDFRDTPEYEKIADRYQRRLYDIVASTPGAKKAVLPKPGTVTQSSDYNAARKKLDEALGD